MPNTSRSQTDLDHDDPRRIWRGALSAIRGRRAAEPEPLDRDWPVWDMARHHHRTEKGKPLAFAERPYLREIYKVWRGVPRDIRITLRKCPQEGLSTWALCTVFTYAGEFGLAVFYVLPKYDLRNTFVQTNVNPTIRNTPRYRSRIRADGADRLGLKLMGQTGTLVFPSANVESDFLAIQADIAIVDELDRYEVVENLHLLEDRLSGHDSRKVWVNISSPTFKGTGISVPWERSDQRFWHVPCSRCGEVQAMSWWENVVEPVGGAHRGEYRLRDEVWTPGSDRDIDVICKACGDPMNRLADGEWAATREAHRHLGFQISKLHSSARSVAWGWELFKAGQEDQSALQEFYNGYLGEDFDAPGVGITESLLEHAASRRPYVTMPDRFEEDGTTAGIDVGKHLHVRISDTTKGDRRAIFLGRIPLDEDELVNLLNAFRVETAVIDNGPELNLVTNLKARLNGTSGRPRLWSCRYQKDAPVGLTIRPEEALVVVDRTWALDKSWQEFRAGRNLIPQTWRDIDAKRWPGSMTGPKRMVDEKGPRPRWVWSKPAYDHHRHADSYDNLAAAIGPSASTIWIGEDDAEGDRRFRDDPMPRAEGEASGLTIDDDGDEMMDDGDRLF